jgi:hypothetical protein
MIEKRQYPRKEIDPGSAYLRKRKKGFFVVVDAKDNKNIGYLCDVSCDGLKLTSESQVKTNSLLDLVLILPEALSGRDYIRFKAKCKWCYKEFSSNDFVAGFQFFSIEQNDNETLRHLLNCLGDKQSQSKKEMSDSTPLKI